MITYERYEEIRNSKGLKNADVARLAKIPPSTFTDWKQGKSTPKYEKMSRIAEILGVTVEYMETDANSSKDTKYYLNEETAKLAQELFDNPDMRILFDAARDSKPEDLQRAADLLKRFKETNPDG